MLTLFYLGITEARAQASPWLEPAFIQQAFAEVALRNEYQSREQTVRKWHKPIKVWLAHRVGDAALHTQLVQMHLAHLQAITGHPISLTDTKAQANIELVFTRQSLWQQEVLRLMGPDAVAKLHGTVCIAHFKQDDEDHITQAFVIIPVDQAKMHGKLIACIVEELTQVLGLPNDSDKVFPSIFNDKTPQTLLSGLDGILLKALYDKNIKAGMTRAQVKPILSRLLKQWQADGSLSRADTDIRQGQLYPLLGF